MKIVRLKPADKNSLGAINRLLSQLSSRARPMTSRDFSGIVKDKNTPLFILRSGKKIVGMGTLVFILTATGRRARIEDVVINEGHRGRGWGRMLMRQLINEARRRRPSYIELTSRPSRVAANRLYKELGFKRHHTNVYRLI